MAMQWLNWLTAGIAKSESMLKMKRKKWSTYHEDGKIENMKLWDRGIKFWPHRWEPQAVEAGKSFSRSALPLYARLCASPCENLFKLCVQDFVCCASALRWSWWWGGRRGRGGGGGGLGGGGGGQVGQRQIWSGERSTGRLTRAPTTPHRLWLTNAICKTLL